MRARYGFRFSSVIRTLFRPERARTRSSRWSTFSHAMRARRRARSALGEGIDLSAAWRGHPGPERDSVYLMNFSSAYDWLETGMSGAASGRRTHLCPWLDGRTELFEQRRGPSADQGISRASPQPKRSSDACGSCPTP